MAEQLESLLKRIEDQAVSKGESQAREKVHKAEQQAARIVADAESRARSILTKADEQVALKEENGRKNLEQATRDFLLLVRQAVTDQLSGLIRQALKKDVSPDFLTSILSQLLPELIKQNPDGATVQLSEEDHARLSDGVMSLLADEVKKGVELRPTRGVRVGFKLVLDGQNIHIDLTDDALVPMISQLVNADVAAALDQVTSNSGKSEKSDN